MKPLNYIIFFTIFFSVYGLLNYYLFIRGLQAMPQQSSCRLMYIVGFIFFASAFILGRTLENYWLCTFSKAFVWIGSFWLAAMLYFFLAVVFLDLVRLLNHFIPFYPSSIIENYDRIKLFTFLTTVIVVVCVLIAGHINTLYPRIKELDFHIHKKGIGIKTLNIVAASDIHLGTIIGKSRFDKIVSMINGLNPDIVLLPGDIVDEDLKPVINENLGESLRSIKTKYGVFAVTGNHEYIGGAENAVKYLSENGVRFLRDEAIVINHTAYLVGREDRSASQFGGKRRKPLAEIMTGVDLEYPVIMMDHQPFGLKDARNAGIDLQLSGHTHDGQIWPLNYITDAVYEKSWGYLEFDSTHIYISNGVGTWGPPVRVGNRPEIIHITLKFD
jgi:uncharacterized protein